MNASLNLANHFYRLFFHSSRKFEPVKSETRIGSVHESDMTSSDSKSILNGILMSATCEGNLAKVEELVDTHGLSERVWSLLCEATKLGRCEIVKFLLHAGAEVNKEESNIDTPLHFAAEQDCEEIVRILIENNAQIDAVNNQDETPLHFAAKKGYLEIVQLLLTNAANVNARTCKGSTPLLLAVESEHENVVKFLLLHGACVNAKNSANNTPLYLAIEKKNSRLVNNLLQHNPHFDEKIHKLVVHIIVHDAPRSEIVENLLNHGFSLSSEDMSGCNLLPVAVIKGYTKLVECLLSLTADSVSLFSLLQYAVGMGHKEIIKLFLNLGCEVRGTDIIDYVPVWSLEDGNKRGNVEIIQMLLESGADVKGARMLLHKAVDKECFEVCKILLENSADVNAFDKHGYTPLHVAVCKIYKQAEGENEETLVGKIVKLLLSNGGDVSLKTKDGLAVIHRASLNRREDAIRILLDYGVDIDSRAKDNSTPLHVASAQGYKELVQFLLNRANVDARQKDGWTPLLVAANGGHSEVVNLLVEFGGNIDARSTTSETALHLAARNEHHEIVAILINSGCDVNVKNSTGERAFDVVIKKAIFLNRYSRSDALSISYNYPTTKLFKMHAIKLKVAGLCINEKLARLINDGFDFDKMKDFQSQCQEELRKMNDKKCSDYTLRDILVGPKNPTFARDESLVQAFESVDFHEYPIYRGLLVNCFRKSKQRIALLAAAQKSLEILLKTSNVFNKKKSRALPAEILEGIVFHLNEEDLRHLICCGESLKKFFSPSGNGKNVT